MQRRTAGRRAHVLDEAAFISTPPPQLRRRTNTDGATSPVPLTPYTGNQHGGYASAGHQQAYFNLNDEDKGGPTGLVVKADLVRQLQRIGKQLMDGLEDASRVDRSLAAIQRDKELRAHVIKSTVINLVALSSIIVFDLLLLPTLGHSHASPFAAAKTRRVRLAFDILWKYPVFGFCFWINTFWSRTISKRALNMQPSSSRGNTTSTVPETDSLDLTDRVIALLPRFLIIGTHTTIGLILSEVPWIGRPISLAITCLVDAYYCFEPSFKTRGYSLYDIGKYFVNGRIAYFIGFGIVPTLLTAHVPFLASVIIFALIYPICVIQAIQTRSRFVDVSSSVEDGMDSPGIESSAPSRGRRPNARGIYKRFLQAFFSAAMLSAKIGGVAGQTYSEELTLKPLPNGKMSLLFDFKLEGPSATEHFRLAPPSLLLPLQHNNVSEMHLSLVTGRWKTEQWGQPQHLEIGGTGAELRAWFRDEKPDESWQGVSNALAGLFCSSLGQIDPSITAAPENIFPDHNSEGLSFRHAQLPAENLCTENLTPFLKLLPCKGTSGLSALMKPYVLLAHEWHAMAIDYIDDNGVTKLGLRWEAVVDMAKGRVEDINNLDFSVSSLFDRNLPGACPAAVSSRLVVAAGTTGTRVIILDDAGAVHPDGGLNWSLGPSLAGKDVKLRILGRAAPRTAEPITVSRTLIGSTHSNSGFSTIITNYLDVTRQVVYTEELPWWIRLWLSELEITVAGYDQDDVLKGMTLHPSIPRTRPTLLQLHIELPPQSQVQVRVPFTKEYIRYTEHLPDASRGWELPPAIIFLPEETGEGTDANASFSNDVPEFYYGRRTRLYTSKLLVDLPTPDFSMPYNVIIMTSTLIALFFGSVVNLGVRRWGVISLKDKVETDEIEQEKVDL